MVIAVLSEYTNHLELNISQYLLYHLTHFRLTHSKLVYFAINNNNRLFA